MKVVNGLFYNYTDMKRALSALNRHRFTINDDTVQVIDQSKIFPEDAIGGKTGDLSDTLIKLGVGPQQADIYAKNIKQGAMLILVKTPSERTAEALNLIRRTDIGK